MVRRLSRERAEMILAGVRTSFRNGISSRPDDRRGGGEGGGEAEAADARSVSSDPTGASGHVGRLTSTDEAKGGEEAEEKAEAATEPSSEYVSFDFRAHRRRSSMPLSPTSAQRAQAMGGMHGMGGAATAATTGGVAGMMGAFHDLTSGRLSMSHRPTPSSPSPPPQPSSSSLAAAAASDNLALMSESASRRWGSTLDATSSIDSSAPRERNDPRIDAVPESFREVTLSPVPTGGGGGRKKKGSEGGSQRTSMAIRRSAEDRLRETLSGSFNDNDIEIVFDSGDGSDRGFVNLSSSAPPSSLPRGAASVAVEAGSAAVPISISSSAPPSRVQTRRSSASFRRAADDRLRYMPSMVPGGTTWVEASAPPSSSRCASSGDSRGSLFDPPSVGGMNSLAAGLDVSFGGHEADDAGGGRGGEAGKDSSGGGKAVIQAAAWEEAWAVVDEERDNPKNGGDRGVECSDRDMSAVEHRGRSGKSGFKYAWFRQCHSEGAQNVRVQRACVAVVFLLAATVVALAVVLDVKDAVKSLETYVEGESGGDRDGDGDTTNGSLKTTTMTSGDGALTSLTFLAPPDPPANLDEICSAEEISSTLEGWEKCRKACDDAECCFGPLWYPGYCGGSGVDAEAACAAFTAACANLDDGVSGDGGTSAT